MEVDGAASREFKEFTPIIGGMMKKFVDKSCRMFIQVKDTLAGGTKIEGNTTDKQTITIELQEPVNQLMQGWIEVLGVPQSPQVFRGELIYCFEQNENNEPFDEESHNNIISIFHNISEEDLYKFR